MKAGRKATSTQLVALNRCAAAHGQSVVDPRTIFALLRRGLIEADGTRYRVTASGYDTIRNGRLPVTVPV